MNNYWKIYWLVVALATANYLVMVLWSLPQITGMAGDQVPFDMRPTGYSYRDAIGFLNAINASGRDFYLNTQQLFDTFYPTLFAVSVAAPLIHLMPRYLGWPAAVLAIGAAAFDYLENSAVATMLKAEPTEISEVMVSTVSNFTLAKSVLTTVVLLILFVVLGRRAISWLKARITKAG